MLLVTESQIAELDTALGGGAGFRTASVRVARDPFDFARTGAGLVDRAVAFSSPEGVRVAGLGTAWRTSASGADRFVAVRDALADLDTDGLRAFFGFSFLDEPNGPNWSGYDAAEAFVPRLTIEGSDGGATITVVVPPGEDNQPILSLLSTVRTPQWQALDDPGDHATEALPPVSVWADQVAAALKSIEAGDLEKVVLARSVTVTSQEPPPILRMFRSLVRSYPQCYNFAWKSGDAVFMGASPELLASVHGEKFTANPLAGSAPRGEGTADDDRIGVELLRSDKDRMEHAFVVDGMVDALASVATQVEASSAPELKKMATVQHLSSRVGATLNPDVGILDVVAAVHPTAAVGGTPSGAAIDFIDRTEAIDRGWYTGGVGWVDTHGNGSIAIALRCGLIRDTTTQLFAGAGIVAGSDPAAEVEETRLKLIPLMRLLTAS
jgi:menaquinone-specific isochorismate synthase